LFFYIKSVLKKGNFLRNALAESTCYFRKGFYKTKIMRLLCRQLTLLLIVLVLRKSAHVTENAKNAFIITTRKTKNPTVQDKRYRSVSFVFHLMYVWVIVRSFNQLKGLKDI